MSFPSRPTDKPKRSNTSRDRSSSFTNVIRKQYSDSVFNQSVKLKRPSFEFQSQQAPNANNQMGKKRSHNKLLSLTASQYQQQPTLVGSYIDDSGSEDGDFGDAESMLYPQPYTSLSTNFSTSPQQQHYDMSQDLVDSPAPTTLDEHKSLANSFKEKLVISRKNTSSKGNASTGVFGNILGSKSTSTTATTNSQSLYDDGSNAIYPPPQKQTGQRDQYGFLKSSQWITDEAFDDFEKQNVPIMKRRLLKWRQLLAENNGQFPPKSSKVKRYVRKGIPPELRGQVWLHYSGAKQSMEDNPGVYESLVQQAEIMGNKNENLDIIERDLHRTFPENNLFRPEDNTADDDDIPAEEKRMNIPIIKSLKRLLLAFSLYSTSIGYCQSLNYIAGMLLLFMKEEEAFWTFVTVITVILPPNIYDVTMEGTNIDQNVLMVLLSERYPQIWNRISGGKTFWECEEESMPTCSLVTSHWFLTLFINILPIESVLRVWDCLFYDGEKGQKVLFRVALGIFKLNESEILAVHDPLEVFQVIQNMPKRMIDCHQLIDGTYSQFASTTRISDGEIEERRDLFRRRRDERRRNIPVQKGGKLVKRGTVRGAIIHRAKEARWVLERAKTVKK